jgi:S-adenosyl methyltransferase
VTPIVDNDSGQPALRDLGNGVPPGTHESPPGWTSGPDLAERGPHFDPSVPHPARVYAYWLGGKDTYEADRKAAEEVMRLRPQVVASARANRAFLALVVRFLAADCGIRQFLDIGTGLPAPDNTHQVAQDVAPQWRVVYVDNDPVVMAHARALLTSTGAGVCDYIHADARPGRHRGRGCAHRGLDQAGRCPAVGDLAFRAG